MLRSLDCGDGPCSVDDCGSNRGCKSAKMFPHNSLRHVYKRTSAITIGKHDFTLKHSN